MTDVIDRVSAARTYLVAKIPFLGFLALKLRPRESDEVPTAGVGPDGTLFLNPDYVSTLSDPELRGLLAHEVMHPAMYFFQRQGNRTLFSWNCFPAGTVVSGAWQPIEELHEASPLLTRSGMGQATEDLHVREYSGAMHTVKALGLASISCTPGHPVLTFRRRNCHSYPIKMTDESEWVEAKDLRAKEHYLCVPRVKGMREDTVLALDQYAKAGRWGEYDIPHNCRRDDFPLTEDTAWLMGLYVAEGDVSSDRVRLTLGSHEEGLANHVGEIVNGLGWASTESPIPERNGLRVSVGSSLLARLFLDIIGTGSRGKRIPDCILFHKNEKLLRAFLEGYQDGDGWDLRGAWCAGTASRVLALQIQLAWARLGRMAKITMRPQKDRYIRDTFIEGGVPFYLIAAHEGKVTERDMGKGPMRSQNSRWRVTDEFILTPVLSNTMEEFEGKVYNIATSDHTYNVENAVVHNCAHDYAINLLISDFIRSDPRIQLPPGGLLDEKYRDMSAEEVWESFPKKQQNQDAGSGEQDGGSLQGDCLPSLCDTEAGKAVAKGDQAAAERLKREWGAAIVAAAESQEKQSPGTMPGNLKILIEEMLDPKVSWYEVLSAWLGENAGKDELSYSRPSRRSESVGEILIGRRRMAYPDVTILWDTSGSMYGEEKVIFPELAAICEDLSLSIRVMIIDTAIHADLEDVTEAAAVAEALKGGGGSDFNPAFVRLDEERNTSVVIAFTDGYIGVPAVMPECLKGTIWVLTSRGVNPTEYCGKGVKWGSVIRLDENHNGKWE